MPNSYAFPVHCLWGKIMRIEDRKLMELRKAKNISMARLGAAIYASADKVSKVERGTGRYSEDQVLLAMEFLDIAGMPLTEEARGFAKQQINVFRNNVRERQFGDAEVMYNKLKNIVNLEPCDPELVRLFRLAEVHYQLFTDKLKDGEEGLNYLRNYLEVMDPLQKYYFYCSEGTWHVMYGRYKDGLGCCYKALVISHNDDSIPDDEIPRLLGNIAVCYSHLQFPSMAIIYALKACILHPEKIGDKLTLALSTTLAHNYLFIDAIYEAEVILKHCRMQANAINDKYFIGLNMYHYGVFHIQSDNWKEALPYLDKILENFDKDTPLHFAATNRKIRCLTDGRSFTEAGLLLDKAQTWYGKHEIYSIYIQSLGRYLTISDRKTLLNEEAVDYILNVTVPHYIKNHDFFELEDYLILVRENLEKRGNSTGALKITAMLHELDRRCPSDVKGVSLL